MKSKLIKGLALLSFITLISTFLFYNAGYFDRKIERLDDNPQPVVSMPVQENSNASINSAVVVDTGTLPKERFPSSKSMKVTLDRFSLLKKRAIPRDSTLKEKDVRMMSSSKSGAIFDASTFVFDSVVKKSDSQKIEKKKQE